MTFHNLKNTTSASGYISEKRVFKTAQCQNCPNKDKCTTSETGRSVEYSPLLEKYRKISLENITNEHGIMLRLNRSIQVEGAFGVLKQDYRFRRFLTRGEENVTTEMFLLCFAMNVNKYNHKQRDKRTQTYLFKQEVA
ncbi:MAG: transposase [Clostridia bacterium]|nr:transposase [Clostridia bacterium]